MLTSLTVALLLLSAVQAASLTKRDNSYGDEPVPPSTESPLTEGTPLTTPAEEVASTVEQATPSEQPSVESSGYRKKRDNSYGDEPITPAAAPEAAGGYPAPAEEAPAPVEQPPPPASQPPVEASGYRKKRSNEYGDEPVPPPAAAAPPSAYEAPEQAPAPVEQPPQPAAYPVESSGY